jgi:tRNA 2-thiocytidine biosynthesis protein TtcA
MLIQIEDKNKEQSIIESLEKTNLPSKTLLSLTAQAIHQFSLIQENDRVAVGCSGGKDSLALIAILNQLQKRKDIPRFDFTVIHLDQHQPNFQRELFWKNINELGVECTIISKDTWSVVEKQLKPGQIPCAVCGRLRRGILNQWCLENGYQKLALGHHLDDAIETFFLNLLFGRKLNPLKPSTPSAKHQVTTIRPMILIEERKIKDWVEKSNLSPVPCPVCDSFPDAKRRDLKQMMDQFRTLQSDVHSSMRTAIYENPELLGLLAQNFDDDEK